MWHCANRLPCIVINTIRIIVADDHQMIREGLRALLRDVPGIKVVGEAEDGRAALRLAAELLPDVVVMDVSMPDLNGIDATRQLMANGKTIKVIALSGKATARSAREMLEAGASGFVRKESAFKELAEAIHSAMKGQVYISPALGEIMATEGAAHNDHDAKLSIREREVLQLASEGRSTKEIARHLSVSIKTIETHRRNLMEKLNLFSTAELTKYAIREGVTSAEK